MAQNTTDDARDILLAIAHRMDKAEDNGRKKLHLAISDVRLLLALAHVALRKAGK